MTRKVKSRLDMPEKTESFLQLQNSFNQLSFALQLMILLCFFTAIIYFIFLFRSYIKFLRELETNNKANAAKFGIGICHNFAYSWRAGVSLTVIKLEQEKKKAEGSCVAAGIEDDYSGKGGS